MIVTNRYHGFSELPGVSKSKKTKNHVSQEDQEKFAGKCRVCGHSLQYIDGTNVMVCSNPECKGSGRKDEDYIPVYRCLNPKSTKTAKRLFGETET